MASLIIIPIAFIMQKLGFIQHLMYDPTRFSGLLIDPNYFTNFQIIPTLLLLFFIMKNDVEIINKIILYIFFVLSISVILWSGSRSGILGLLFAILLLFIFFIKFAKINNVKIFSVLLLVMISFPLGFLAIPKISTPHEQGQTQSLNQTSINKIIPKIRIETFSKPSNLVSGQGRLNIWNNSTSFILKNPLGYGPGYNQIINLQGDGGEHRVAHNFELELLLQGGVLSFIFFNYLIIKLLMLYRKPYFKNFNEIHALTAIMIGMLISALFLDSTPEKWIWVIMALIIVYNKQFAEAETL
jgi:O-antigen ligase